MFKCVQGGREISSGARAAWMVVTLVGASVLALPACKKEAAPPPPPKAPSAPQPTAPPPAQDEVMKAEAVRIDQIMAQLKPDARVQFAQDLAPSDPSVAKAIVSAADALAKGSDSALRAMLAPDAQSTLDGLVNSGDWETSTKRIEGVRVIAVKQEPKEAANAEKFVVQFAIQEPGEAYLIGWEGSKQGANWKLSGSKAPAGTKPRASDWAGGDTSSLSHSGRASAGMSGADSGRGMDADSMTVTAGLPILLAQKYAKDAGMDLKSFILATGQQLPPNVDMSIIEGMGTQARALIAKGVMPDQATFKLNIDVMLAQPAMTKAKLFEATAEVTGVAADKWQALYDGKRVGSGGGGGGKNEAGEQAGASIEGVSDELAVTIFAARTMISKAGTNVISASEFAKVAGVPESARTQLTEIASMGQAACKRGVLPIPGLFRLLFDHLTSRNDNVKDMILVDVAKTMGIEAEKLRVVNDQGATHPSFEAGKAILKRLCEEKVAKFTTAGKNRLSITSLDAYTRAEVVQRLGRGTGKVLSDVEVFGMIASSASGTPEIVKAEVELGQQQAGERAIVPAADVPNMIGQIQFMLSQAGVKMTLDEIVREVKGVSGMSQETLDALWFLGTNK